MNLKTNGKDIRRNHMVVKAENIETFQKIEIRLKITIKIRNLENGLKNIKTVLIVNDRRVSLKNNIVNMVVKNNLKTIL
jgi:hypothetical protein